MWTTHVATQTDDYCWFEEIARNNKKFLDEQQKTVGSRKEFQQLHAYLAT